MQILYCIFASGFLQNPVLSRLVTLYRFIDDTYLFSREKKLYRKKNRGWNTSKIEKSTYQQLSFFTLLISDTLVRATIISSVNLTILEFLNQTIWQDFKLPVCSVVSFLKVLWQAAVGSRLKILHAGRSKAERHILSLGERSAELPARALNQNIQLWSL